MGGECARRRPEGSASKPRMWPMGNAPLLKLRKGSPPPKRSMLLLLLRRRRRRRLQLLGL